MRDRGIYVKFDNSFYFYYQNNLIKTELGACRVLLESGGDMLQKVEERLMV